MPLAILAIVLIAYWAWSDGQPNPFRGAPPLPRRPLGPFIPGDRVIVIGLPLSGKTYLVGKKLTVDCPRILFFDPYHDYNEMAGAEEISANKLIENPSILNKSTFRYAIIPDEDFIADQLDDSVRIARAAGNLVFVMDEVGDYKREATLTMEKLARNGRHDGLVPIYVSQVAMDIPRTVRRIATRVYSFRQEDIEDIDALSERYGESYANEVSHLELHEYRLWTLPGFGRSVKAEKQRPSQSAQSSPNRESTP